MFLAHSCQAVIYDSVRCLARGQQGMWQRPEPVSLADVSVTTDGIVLVRDPHHENDVEGSRCVVEELRHDRLHPCNNAQLQRVCVNRKLTKQAV